MTAQRRKDRRLAKIAKAQEKLAAALSADGVASPAPSTSTLPETKPKPTPTPALDVLTADEPTLEDEEPVIELEHLQLQREEAFFLVFGLGALDVLLTPSSDRPLTILECWALFAGTGTPRPDNSFVVSYVAYHHYRSLGWVARSGVKFCVDWVLYRGADGSGHRGGVGPVGGHAECVALCSCVR